MTRCSRDCSRFLVSLVALIATSCADPPTSLVRTPVGVRVITEVRAGVVGGSLQFSARAFNSTGAFITGVNSRWRSLDSAIVRVTPDGLATFVAPGQTELEVRMGEIRERVRVGSVAPPIPSWGDARGWHTFQGTNSRNAVQPVVADFRTFQYLWGAGVGHYSGPPVSDGTAIFATGMEGYLAHLQARSLNTGALLWRRQFAPFESPYDPAVGAGRLFAQVREGFFYILWATDGGDAVAPPYVFAILAPHSAPPLIASPYFFSSRRQGGGRAAYRIDDGEAHWEAFDVSDASNASAWGDHLYYFTATAAATSGGILKVDAATGDSVDFFVHPSFDGMQSSPVTIAISDDGIAALTNKGRLVVFDLVAGTHLWTLPDFSSRLPLISNGVVVAWRPGAVEAREAHTGELRWRWVNPHEMTGWMVATSNLVFVASGIRTFALDIASGLAVWAFEASGTMLVINGKLVISSSGSFACVGLQ